MGWVHGAFEGLEIVAVADELPDDEVALGQVHPFELRQRGPVLLGAYLVVTSLVTRRTVTA